MAGPSHGCGHGNTVIGDHNWWEHVDVTVDGEKKARGGIPRPYAVNPYGSYKSAPPTQVKIVPREEWPDRIKEGHANKTFLSYLRRRRGPNGGAIPALDQNGKGYCWAHSTTSAVMLLRAAMNEPYVRLSAYMVACIIKNYRDEGGWGAASLDFIQENGVAPVSHWPEKSMSRSNDNPEMRAEAKKYIITDAWEDTASGAYDRNLSEDQSMSLLFARRPLVSDFNWWSHSVCAMDPIVAPSAPRIIPDLRSLDLNDPRDFAVFAAIFGKKILNSWTDSWGDQGEGDLTGTRAILDGGVSPVATLPTAA